MHGVPAGCSPSGADTTFLQAAARHQCRYLVNLHVLQFLRAGGDPQWLRGLDFIPPKLRNLNEINKILAHRPWLITKEHIEVAGGALPGDRGGAGDGGPSGVPVGPGGCRGPLLALDASLPCPCPAEAAENQRVELVAGGAGARRRPPGALPRARQLCLRLRLRAGRGAGGPGVAEGLSAWEPVLLRGRHRERLQPGAAAHQPQEGERWGGTVGMGMGSGTGSALPSRHAVLLCSPWTPAWSWTLSGSAFSGST